MIGGNQLVAQILDPIFINQRKDIFPDSLWTITVTNNGIGGKFIMKFPA